MKIGFASRYDPLDKKTWSGSGYYTLGQLKRFGDVEIFQYPLPKLLQEWLTAQKSIHRRLFKKNIAAEFLKSYSKYFSRQLKADLKKRPVDVLFVLASSQMIAYVKTSIPVIYMTDATFQQLQGYYSNFSNLAAYNVRQGISLDKRAFHNAAHCMLASDWCKTSAIDDYGIAPEKISVVPMGANLDTVPVWSDLNFTATERCNLLFLGVEWERKGGDIALSAFKKIKQNIPGAQLKIIGCVPPHDLSDDKDITIIPFFDKNKKEDFRQLYQVFLQTDFLLLPTRAECAGIVFSEAAAYGIPSITTDTGGVGTYVQNGVNGFALPPQANGNDYATIIAELLNDKTKLSVLKRSSRRQFEEKLNWDNWGNNFKAIIEKLVSQKK